MVTCGLYERCLRPHPGAAGLKAVTCRLMLIEAAIGRRTLHKTTTRYPKSRRGHTTCRPFRRQCPAESVADLGVVRPPSPGGKRAGAGVGDECSVSEVNRRSDAGLRAHHAGGMALPG